MWLVVISAAAASLGGTSGLAWGSQYLRAPALAGVGGGTPLPVHRSPVWIVVGAALAALLVSRLGPGIRFH